MNILQMEDLVKGMPDEMLMQEAQMPSGQIPQFLALSEVQRRKEMRDKFQAPPQATVADQIMQGGIASAMPQQPPQGGMAPPQGPPQGGPPVQMYGGGMVPSYMQAGGPIGSNEQAAVLREAQSGKARFADFLRQNLTTPQGLGRLAAGAIGTSVGGPLAGYAASAGFNRLFPMGPTAVESAQQKAYQAMNPFNTYGKSFAQAGADRQAELDQAGAMALGNRYQDYLNRMTNPFAGTGSGIVRDERLGDQSLNLDDYGMGMYGGGQVPYRMQEGRTVPGTNPAISDLNARIASAIMPRRAQFTVIREAKALRDQGKIDEAINLLTQEGIDPRQVLGGAPRPAAPAAAPAVAPDAPAPEAAPSAGPINMLALPMRPMGLTPDFSAMAAPSSAPGMTPPAGGAAPPVSGMDIAGANVDITTLFPQARGVVGGRGSGMPQDLAAGIKPYEDILAVDPNAAVFKGTDFTSLIEQQQKRGAERAASYEQTIKGIENEMKRERLGAVLTTLGANLMAGEGALGLEKAGALAQQIGKETRQEIAAERRAARTAEDATSDRIFALNAQQLTSDTEAQRALYTAQRGVKEKALEFLQKDIGNRQQAEQAANQLAATLTVSMVNSIRDKVVSEGADRRSALSFAQSLAKEQLEILSANPQLAAMPKEDLQNLINQTMRAALETAFSAVGTALPPTFNTGGPRRGSTAQSGPREKSLSSFMNP